MTYNNFPIGYQPAQMYYPPQQNNTTLQNNPIIWVQGEAGAKSYLVAPNTTVYLWDSENPIIYVKSADNMGVPTIRIIDYKYRDAQPNNTMDSQKYVTWDEFKKFKEDLMNSRSKNDDK